MTRCPGCGAAVLETLVSREAIAEEIRLRQLFYEHRIDGGVGGPERKDTLDVVHGGEGAIAICRTCEILVRREETAAPRFEDDRYEPFVMERMLRAHIDAFRKKEALYRPLLPAAARVLEVGSYSGGFLHVAGEWGWDATGVEIGGDTSHFSRSHAYRTVAGPLQACRFDRGAFDGVFVWNCFEQIPEPDPFLDEVRRILRPGGVLVLRMPNALLYMLCQSLLVVRRAQAAPLDDHDPIVIVLGHGNLLGFPHLFGYTAGALDRLSGRHGFEPALHAGDSHIDPGVRPLTASAVQEAERVAAATRMVPPWFEAAYRG